MSGRYSAHLERIQLVRGKIDLALEEHHLWVYLGYQGAPKCYE